MLGSEFAQEPIRKCGAAVSERGRQANYEPAKLVWRQRNGRGPMELDWSHAVVIRRQ
jgi:hypothetical protein